MKVKVLTMLIAAALSTTAQANPVNDAGKTVGWAIGSVFGSILGVVQDTFQGIEDGIEGKDLTVKGNYAEKAKESETNVVVEPLETPVKETVEPTKASTNLVDEPAAMTSTDSTESLSITEPIETVEPVKTEAPILVEEASSSVAEPTNEVSFEAQSTADSETDAVEYPSQVENFNTNAEATEKIEQQASNETSESVETADTTPEASDITEQKTEEGLFSRFFGFFKKDSNSSTEVSEKISSTDGEQKVETMTQDFAAKDASTVSAQESSEMSTGRSSEVQAVQVIEPVIFTEEFTNSASQNTQAAAEEAPAAPVVPPVIDTAMPTAVEVEPKAQAKAEGEGEYEYVVVRHDQLQDGDIVVESAPSPDAIKIKRGN